MNANWTKSEDNVGHLQSQDYKKKFVKNLINDCNDNLFVVKRGDVGTRYIQNRYLMRSIKSITQEIKRLINLLLSIIPIITKVLAMPFSYKRKRSLLLATIITHTSFYWTFVEQEQISHIS